MTQPTIFQTSIARRWIIIAAAGTLLAAASFVVGTPTIMLVGAFVVASVAVNSLAWLIARTNTSHSSFIVAAFLLDILVATAPVIAIGAGGLLVGMVAVLVPYTLRVSSAMNRFQTTAVAISYIAGVALNGRYFALPQRDWADIPVNAWFEVGVFVAVAIALRVAGKKLNNQLRSIRHALPQTAKNDAADNIDELNALTISLQHLTQRFDKTVHDVSGETQTIVDCANVVRSSAEKAADATAKLVASSGVVVEGLEVQRRGAEAGERRGHTAIEYARELGASATTVANEVSALLQHAESARKQIQRSHESLSSIEHDVGGTLNALDGIKSTAHATNETLQAVLSIARQTHVLALNTAIKSANGEISQESSSEIAARFRTLAADTSASTRDAAQMVDEMKEHTAAAERAMRAGQVQTRDAVMFTETAIAVLQELHLAALRSNELVGASVDVTRIQTEHLNELSQHLSDAATSRVDTTHYIASASQAVTHHRATIKELEQVVALLAETAARISHQFSSLSAEGGNGSSNKPV